MITQPLHESLSKPPGDRLAFLHIPKTAGTSLTRALATHWGRVKIIGDNRILASMGPNDLKDVSLFAGHFYAHQLAHPALLGFTPITVLRDPLARLFSEYRFASTVAKSGQPLPPRMEFALKVSFFEYAFSEAGQAGLHAQLYILGIKSSMRTLKWTPQGEFLRSAQDTVSRMRIGITENLSPFVAKLFAEVGATVPAIPNLNTQEHSKEDGLTFSQRQTLREVLAADYALYNYGREQMERWLDT